MKYEKQELLMEFFKLQNLITEQQNYLEILCGYCENSLEKSDDLNKIYPLLITISELQSQVSKSAENFASGF